MKNANHIRPFEREHSLLSLVNEGKKNLVIDLTKIPELINESDTEEDLAQEIYQAEIESQGSYAPYIQVNTPVLENGHWVIKKTLTTLGQSIFDSLEGGVLWNTTTASMDYVVTEEYYDEMLKKGSIDMRYVDLVSNNPDVNLKSIKGKLVYFKLQGQKEGAKITKLA